MKSEAGSYPFIILTFLKIMTNMQVIMDKKREKVFSNLSACFVCICTLFLVLVTVYGTAAHLHRNHQDIPDSGLKVGHLFSLD